MKKTKAATEVQQSRRIGLAGRASTSAARDMATATGSNRAVLDNRPQRMVEGGGDEEEMADVDEEEEAVRDAIDVTMAATDTATRTATDTETETETGALPTNDLSDAAQLHKVIQMDHCAAADWSRTHGGRSVLARATKRKG